MKVGDYVRNCYGRIAKIEYIEDNIAYCDNWLTQQYEDHIDFINLKDEEDLDEIIKSSPNIIDLIEVGDYVNGVEVIDLADGIHLEFANNVSYVDVGLATYRDGHVEGIETIVTKECFERMKYKVKE